MPASRGSSLAVIPLRRSVAGEGRPERAFCASRGTRQGKNPLTARHMARRVTERSSGACGFPARGLRRQHTRNSEDRPRKHTKHAHVCSSLLFADAAHGGEERRGLAQCETQDKELATCVASSLSPLLFRTAPPTRHLTQHILSASTRTQEGTTTRHQAQTRRESSSRNQHESPNIVPG